MKLILPLLAAAGAGMLLLARCTEEATGPSRGPIVRIDASPAHLVPGEATRIGVFARDGQGRPVEDEVEWSSTDPTVAAVDAGGTVTAVAPGGAAVVAAAGEARDSVRVIVAPPVLVGAGDIASCKVDGDEATAALLDAIAGIVITTGDNVYPDATAREFAECYHPSWGRHRGRTRPSPGNHEYLTAGASAYYSYFGALAGAPGKGYYSYDFAGWHVVVLNSEIDTSEDSEQVRWLREDLAATSARCVLAYWHRPRFSSGKAGNDPEIGPLWAALYEAGAELVLNGHDHYYERFAPQAPDGTADAGRGIRQIVVGTGGQPPYPPEGSAVNSEVQQSTTLGVLKLSLHGDGYDWEFVPVAGGTFRDAGSDACH